jgi:hypothetical protein
VSLVLGAALSACGDDDSDGEGPTATSENDVLHLRGYDMTVANFRLAIRNLFVGDDPTFCDSIRGLTPAEAVDALDILLVSGLPTGLPVANATPISDEAQRSREDEERAASIALEECGEVSATASPGS